MPPRASPDLARRFLLAVESRRFSLAELAHGRPVRALVEGVVVKRGNTARLDANPVRCPPP